jgi:hypothetical protein
MNTVKELEFQLNLNLLGQEAASVLEYYSKCWSILKKVGAAVMWLPSCCFLSILKLYVRKKLEYMSAWNADQPLHEYIALQSSYWNRVLIIFSFLNSRSYLGWIFWWDISRKSYLECYCNVYQFQNASVLVIEGIWNKESLYHVFSAPSCTKLKYKLFIYYFLMPWWSSAKSLRAVLNTNRSLVMTTKWVLYSTQG